MTVLMRCICFDLFNLHLCDSLSCLLDNIYIRFDNKLYRKIVGIPMGTICAPFEADFFLFCYERDRMTSLSDDNQVDIIKAFNFTSRYLDDLLIWVLIAAFSGLCILLTFLNIDTPYFEGMVNQIYPPELQ